MTVFFIYSLLLMIYRSHSARSNSQYETWLTTKTRTVFVLKFTHSLQCILHSPIKLVVTWLRNLSLILQKVQQPRMNKDYRKMYFTALLLFSSSRNRSLALANIAYCRNYLFIKITFLFYFLVYLNTLQYLAANATEY